MIISTGNFCRIAEALFSLTPGKILVLLQKYHIRVIICRRYSKKPRGTLARAGKSWVVIVQNTGEDDRLMSLAHELSHLYLFSEGLDEPSAKQEYPDELVEWASALFLLRYPDFLKGLWTYLKKSEDGVSKVSAPT